MLTEFQKEQRRKGIGGSDIGPLFGLSKWASPFSIYQEKIGEREDTISNLPMTVGNLMEDPILAIYQEVTKEHVQKGMPTYVHRDHSYLLANIDGLRDDGWIVEVKNVDRRGDKGPYKGRAWGQEGTDQIPYTYLLQVAHYCMVLDAPGAHIAAYFGGTDLRIYVYTRNPSLESAILLKCQEFWHKHVIPRVPPLEDATVTELTSLWTPSSVRNTIDVDAEIETHIGVLRDICAKKKELAAQEEEAKRKIMLYMQDKDTLLNTDGHPVLTWKSSTRTSIDLKALRESEPAVAEKFSITSTNRTLRVLGEKNDNQ